MRYKSFAWLACGLLCVGGLATGSYLHGKNSLDTDSICSKTYELGENYINEIKEEYDADSVNVLKEGLNGTRELEIVKNGKSYFVNIMVDDTRKPEFVSQCDKVELPLGSTEQDLLSQFKAKDESELLEYYVIGNINYNITGEYKVQIACSDAFANTSTVDVQVVIK